MVLRALLVAELSEAGVAARGVLVLARGGVRGGVERRGGPCCMLPATSRPLGVPREQSRFRYVNFPFLGAHSPAY
jgi:hypothetical protein